MFQSEATYHCRTCQVVKSMAGCITRAELDCPILGKPADLQRNILPCGLDVLRYWKFLKSSVETPGIIPKRHDITARIAADLSEIWASASLPSITAWSIITRIENYLNHT